MIQADFLTTSNRQSIDEDSSWNNNIAKGIPKAFETAVNYLNHKHVDFMSELALRWPCYLDDNTSGLNPYWRSIKISIRQHLRKNPVIKNQDGNFSAPQNLMFLDWARDRDDAPIFGTLREYISLDYPESVRAPLLSLGITTPNWAWVDRKLLELHEEDVLHVKDRTEAWYSDLAKVILHAGEQLDSRSKKQALGTILLHSVVEW